MGDPARAGIETEREQMPRVHKRKAQKDYPNEGIARGDVYYTWKFRRSGVQRSLTPPLPEQLTQSEYAQEWIPLNREVSKFEGSADELHELAERARTLGEEQRDKQGNMPDSLQAGPTGELLEERANECEELADELDEIAQRLEETDENDEDEVLAEVQQAAR